ncbi:MAG: hypothetical protein N4A62_01330, partial [Marinisporobacter sp.]|nr:hypothetical protein [Marinisporobacter sp.]
SDYFSANKNATAFSSCSKKQHLQDITYRTKQTNPSTAKLYLIQSYHPNFPTKLTEQKFD